MIRRPPRSTLFPDPTLFRSGRRARRRPAGYDRVMAPDRFDDVEFRFVEDPEPPRRPPSLRRRMTIDRKSTRLNSSHANISYAVFCLKKKKITQYTPRSIIPP